MVDDRLASLKAMEAFSGTKLAIKEFCNEWILLTFDLPATEEGDKARAKFLKEAKRIGAMPHTESVYLLPWTQEGELIALEVAIVGNAFLWISKPKDAAAAIGLTTKYDEDLDGMVTEFGNRISRIEKHIQNGKPGIAQRMVEVSWDRFKDLQGAIVRRGSVELSQKLMPMAYKLKELDGIAVTQKRTSRAKKKMVFNQSTMKFEKTGG